MTDKEILEYSKQIINAKSEIETSEAAEPDLKEQVRTKFLEDSINRAKFINSTLVIGGATKEFRNVFGVDAPHYELSDTCYHAIDEDGNNFYQDSEKIDFSDPVNNGAISNTFIDCWQMIDAAKFDSTSTIPNEGTESDGSKPVDRQHFFVDSKKAEKSSGLHNPICPPGYDKWAGTKVYEYVCKNFDLTEPVLYKILSFPNQNTIPRDFTLGPFDGNSQFSYNINEKGEITKEVFQYNYENDSKIAESANSDFKLKADGCTPSTNNPIKWYTVKALVSSKKYKDGYYYTYSFEGTPFEKSRTPMAAFRIVNKKGVELNNGFVIFCLDPAQMSSLPTSGSKYKSYQDIKFCVHMIYKKNDTMYDGPIEKKQKKFLWWSWTSTISHKYSINFTPITYSELTSEVKKKFTNFVRIMEQECIKYFDLAISRNIKNDIPDKTRSVQTMKELYNAALNYTNKATSSNWDAFMLALKNRVVYDIYYSVETYSTSKKYAVCDPVLYEGVLYYCVSPTSGAWDSSKWGVVFSNADKFISSSTKMEYVGQNTYISYWKSNFIPGWPRWLRRLFKWWSSPVYTNYDRIKISSVAENRNIEYIFKREYTNSTTYYVGPKGGDLTRFFDSGNMTTRYNLVNYLLSDSDRNNLISQGVLSKDLKTIVINKVSKPVDGTKIEVIFQSSTLEKPPYNNIKRAQEINTFLSSNPNLYSNAFITLSDRINKRTGTLRNLCTLLESTNINAQMIYQRKRNIAKLFGFMNAFEITGGFGGKTATIKLATWEPSTSAYSNLEKLSPVYIVSDLTKIKHIIDGEVVDKFDKSTVVETRIVDIIDKVSETQYSYAVVEDLDLTNADYIVSSAKYYVYDEQSSKYKLISEENQIPSNVNDAYERTGVTSGPIFNVTLSDPIPISFKNRNPILVKLYK